MRIYLLLVLAVGKCSIIAFGQTPQEVFQAAAEAASNHAMIGAEVRFSADILAPKLDVEG